MARDALVDQLRARGPGAFDELYARYRARLWGYLLRLTRRRADAEELYQDVWISLARRAHELAAESDLDAWVFTVARNRYRSYRRWAALDLARLGELFAAKQGAAAERDPELATAEAEALAHLDRALGRLSAADREILLLAGVEGLASEQLASVFGVSDVAARKRLSRARAALTGELARAEVRSGGRS